MSQTKKPPAFLGQGLASNAGCGGSIPALLAGTEMPDLNGQPLPAGAVRHRLWALTLQRADNSGFEMTDEPPAP